MNRLSIAAFLLAGTQGDAAPLRVSYEKGQKFTVTARLQFCADPALVTFRGPSDLRAKLSCEVTEAASGQLSCRSKILEIKGEAGAREGKGVWYLELDLKAGRPFTKFVMSGPAGVDFEKAAREIRAAMEREWVVKVKGLEAGSEGAWEGFGFLAKWIGPLFLAPPPLPFAGRDAKAGDTFKEGGFTWTAGEAGAVTGQSEEGPGPQRKIRLVVDRKGFVSSLKLDVFEKGEERPAVQLETSVERP